MLSFNEELDNCAGEKSIVLGNGFSISYDMAFDENNFFMGYVIRLV